MTDVSYGYTDTFRMNIAAGPVISFLSDNIGGKKNQYFCFVPDDFVIFGVPSSSSVVDLKPFSFIRNVK